MSYSGCLEGWSGARPLTTVSIGEKASAVRVAEDAEASGATAGWPGDDNCVEEAAAGSWGTTVTYEDCDCVRDATAASASGVRREMWPNEEGDN